MFHLVTEEILSPTTFVTEWTSVGYCKTYEFFFWLIFLVRSAPIIDYYETLTFLIDEHKSR